jgi:hypothetical protein
MKRWLIISVMDTVALIIAAAFERARYYLRAQTTARQGTETQDRDEAKEAADAGADCPQAA